ncbi:MAG: ABC transporter permease [Armatimonadota bacterium]|nr:ABC transporter permease [Armatimonadota bacterium]MDR7452333.1 ABC transporter permease [Armatimonadota bacterium]MDR7467776.1 ABC transporter permease [Armatimonadota bacterium]MDR7494638.1 ABC transporter permease [Armatimonadota bacterium]MDR7499698.1 ABC transporter permease [Armatimonadota bacterium]
MWELLARSLEASTIFLFAGLGELIDQRSGVLNVGLEGVMLFGGTAAFITAQTTGSYPLGFAAGLAVGALLGVAHGFFSISLRGDQVVSGMGLWILSFGLTTFLGSRYTGPLGLPRIPAVAGLSPFFPLGVLLIAAGWVLLFRTSLGLAVRSAGENPAAAEASGVNVAAIRYLCVTVGGALAGLSGATYTLSYNPVWTYNFLMGWGFVSLALVFFSMWNPWILLAGATLFGLMWQLSLSPELVLPGVLSRYIWRTVPFAITIPILVVISTSWFRTRWGLARPEALGRPYVKG